MVKGFVQLKIFLSCLHLDHARTVGINTLGLSAGSGGLVGNGMALGGTAIGGGAGEGKYAIKLRV